MIPLRTLVLNSNYMPVSVFPILSTIPVEIGIHRHISNNCDTIHWYDRKIKTQNRHDLYWPSIIVNKNSNYNKSQNVALRKESLFYRDHMVCQYCGTDLVLSDKKPNSLTVDHVYPRVEGGKDEWENVVAACPKCNSEKGSSLPKGKWKPRIWPWKPTYFDLLKIRKNFPIEIYDPAWTDFLPGWSGEIIIKRSSKETKTINSEEEYEQSHSV